MGLLAKMQPDNRGIVEIHRFTTYGQLGELFPRDRNGLLSFAAALGTYGVRYSEYTYERVVMLMTGGFAE